MNYEIKRKPAPIESVTVVLSEDDVYSISFALEASHESWAPIRKAWDRIIEEMKK